MDIEIFFEKLFINSELRDPICNELNITKKEYSYYALKLDNERKEEIQIIKRVRSLYNNKKDIEGFSFHNFNQFYKWYKGQYHSQNGKCYYCKTDEKVIATLFDKKFNNRKRITRGKHLEIERRDSLGNLYSSQNCVLACYFCNNDKSEIFTEDEYFAYLKDRKSFLTSLFEKLND